MGETSNANLLKTGSIPKKIIMFAIPLLWGNLFQQLYNVADSLIVGNFLGNNALAAVSSSGNLIFLRVGFVGGSGVGAGGVSARYFGAGEYEKLKKAIHTALAFGGVCGIFLTVAALILAPQILKLIGTPEEVLPKSLVYFSVSECDSGSGADRRFRIWCRCSSFCNDCFTDIKCGSVYQKTA